MATSPAGVNRTLSRARAAGRSALVRLAVACGAPHIRCNFCGSPFRRRGAEHSEGLECPHCGSIARERLAFQIILNRLAPPADRTRIVGNRALEGYSLLEFSPRYYQRRVSGYRSTFRSYVAADLDQRAHAGEVELDLTCSEHVDRYAGSFDVVLCSHVLEHIPDYRLALQNLSKLLTEEGFVILQVPILERHYVKVTWDEFHGDDTRVFHRFGFDLVDDAFLSFFAVEPVVAALQFPITSDEIDPAKYEALVGGRHIATEVGLDVVRAKGLGSPDLCEALVLSRARGRS